MRNLDPTSGSTVKDWGHFEWTPTGRAPVGETQTAAAAPAAGGTASGDFKGNRVNEDVLKTRIQQSNSEWMKDPENQQKIFRTLQAEGGGNIAANLEQMSNYAASRGKSLQQVVEARGSKQFYGPLRRFHGDPGAGRMMPHERDAYNSAWTPAKQAAWDKASNEVFSGGSNRINYATDQGTVGDPNYDPNRMTNVGGNMFGVQPGTGKWVSAQRGKPQVSGPVAVAAAEPAPARTVVTDPDHDRRMQQHREETAALKQKNEFGAALAKLDQVKKTRGASFESKGEGAIQQQDRESNAVDLKTGKTGTQFPLKSVHGKGAGVGVDTINPGTEGTPEENQRRLEGIPEKARNEVEKPLQMNVKVNQNDVQFARSSMKRQADKEVREARWSSYSDIGAA